MRKVMKNTPISYKNRNVSYDLQLDFSKFLQEARSHANDASLRQLETAKMRGAKNKKKTWIRALSQLFFNCRHTKKKKRKKKSEEEEEEEEEAPLKAKALKLSGVEKRPWLSGSFGELRHKMGLSSSSSSVSLSFCFNPAKAGETEVPYRSLGHQSHALGAQAFGPIYLVT